MAVSGFWVMVNGDVVAAFPSREEAESYALESGAHFRIVEHLDDDLDAALADTQPEPVTSVSVASPRRHRHQYVIPHIMGGGYVRLECACGAIQDPAASRRGRNNRARGNAIEREVGKQLGLRRVGMYGGPDDLSNEMFVAQVKSGGSFSERYWQWLKAVPVNAGQTPLLVVTDAPGPGHKRRAIVVLDLDDWRELHG